MTWITVTVERALFVDRGRDIIACDRGHSGSVTMLLKLEGNDMPDPLKQFVNHMNGVEKAAVADTAAKMMAKHCDKRIKRVRSAIAREEQYLFRVLRAKNTGGVMAGDIEGAFHRLMTALDEPATP